jgi:hypothetical protein
MSFRWYRAQVPQALSDRATLPLQMAEMVLGWPLEMEGQAASVTANDL